MSESYQRWMILQEKSELFPARSAYVCCDRRQHLLVVNNPTVKKASASANNPTLSQNENSSTISGQATLMVDALITICLERIQYIQRIDGTNTGRSARNADQSQVNLQLAQNGRHRLNQKRLEIFYFGDHPRSEYLYKSINIQLKKLDEEFDEWVNALYAVIDEAKNLNEAAKRNREYEKLKRSSRGLTFDSINGWLNSHMGLVGEKSNIEKLIKQNEVFQQSNEITDSVFKTIYYHFVNKQQEILTRTLMSDSVEENIISLEKFALRVTNNQIRMTSQEIGYIRETLQLTPDQLEITLRQSMNYLWSDGNSAFDPLSRSTCIQNMDRKLNLYWIASSHNTYLAKTQTFNPASVHCYIQALLKGCRCVEIDVFDPRTGTEPEITHKGTFIKPIPLRNVLEAIADYAFVTSEYPVIISIENHCSPQQRYVMSRMFIEILGDSLLQIPLSQNENELPSPNKLKRKILLKDTKLSIATLSAQANFYIEEPSESVTTHLEGHVQLYNAVKKNWLNYNYTIEKDNIYLAQVYEPQKQQKIDDDLSDDEIEQKSFSDSDLVQIWYHGNLSHDEAKRLLLSNAAYDVGAFLIRRSANKNCYCLTYLASNSVVRSIEIVEKQTEDNKCLYSIAQKTFDCIPDLVASYRTYDFNEVIPGSTTGQPIRLGKPVPRERWYQELTRKPWYQPDLSRKQAEELLRGIGEEMTFLIRKSSSRVRQDYTISLYANGGVRHFPIYSDGSDLMLMSITFTSLVEIVNYYSHKPIFNDLPLQNPATFYADFIEERRPYAIGGHNKNLVFVPLETTIFLQRDKIRTENVVDSPDNASVQVELHLFEDDRTKPDGYLMKFDSFKEWQAFSARRTLSLPPSTTSTRGPDETISKASGIGMNPAKLSTYASISEQTRNYLAEYDKSIVYCQTVKLRDRNVTKPQDLLDRIRLYTEMISLNSNRGSAFCSDARSMILFNQRHFTRVYPDFTKKSWTSNNFDPLTYWVAGCQMVALNYQMPDRPMHINAGRFAANGGSGYILMPDYIRSFENHSPEISTVSMLLKIRVIAVRHIRSAQAKSISKVQIRITVVGKKRPTEHQLYSTIISGPCGIWNSKQSSPKQYDQLDADNRLQSFNKDVDLLYFEVVTDNEDFCGQSTIPLSSLRAGIRSVQLYDKFNERLDMSALLVDINFQTM